MRPALFNYANQTGDHGWIVKFCIPGTENGYVYANSIWVSQPNWIFPCCRNWLVVNVVCITVELSC